MNWFSSYDIFFGRLPQDLSITSIFLSLIFDNVFSIPVSIVLPSKKLVHLTYFPRICLKITTNSMYLNFFFIIEGWEILFSVDFNKQILLKTIFEMELRLNNLVNQ